MQRKTGLAIDAMRRLQTIWAATDIASTTKVKVYESMVLSILVYNADMDVHSRHTKEAGGV